MTKKSARSGLALSRTKLNAITLERLAAVPQGELQARREEPRVAWLEEWPG